MSILVSVSSFGSSVESSNSQTMSTVKDSIDSPALPRYAPNITLGTTNPSDTLLYQQGNKIMSVAFQRLGYRLTVKTLPNKRSLAWANSGLTDGELFRMSKLNLKNFPNLQQVTETLFTIDQSVLSKKNIKVDGWDSMKNYSLAYERGTKFIEKKVNKFKHVHPVNRTEQAVAMVFNDRADLTITSLSTAAKLLQKNKKYAETIKILKPPLASIILHVYLNKQRHKKLAEALSVVLKEMKRTGQFQKLLDQVKSDSTKTINPTD